MPRNAWRGSALCFALAASFGCGASLRARKVGPDADIRAVNVNQIRLKMRSLAGPLSGEIESTADAIAAESADPAIRRAALHWKIEAVPTLTTALFQPEPVTALVDAWAMTFQMADYFESGPGKAALGASAPVAVETSHRLEQELAETATSMAASHDVSKVRDTVRQWATAHPIRHSLMARETALSRSLEVDTPAEWTSGEAAAEIVTSVDDLNRKVDLYSERLLRQMRWEAELLSVDMGLGAVPPLGERAVRSGEQVASSFDRLQPSLERAVAVGESAPAVLASERRATLEAIGENLTRTIQFLQQERIVALQQVSAERGAAINGMTQMVSEQRQAFEQNAARVAMEVVDHAVWRLAELMAAALVFASAWSVVLVVLIRKLLLRA